jgi:hypothetical protein
MHAISVTRPGSPITHERQGESERATPPAITTADLSAQDATELRRWYVFLGLPFLLAATFFMAAIGTGHLWLIGGTLATGPGLLIMAFIYLSLSSDTNGVQ